MGRIRINKKQIILERNIPEAARWYQEAADGEYNNSDAQNSLGLLFYKSLFDVEWAKERIKAQNKRATVKVDDFAMRLSDEEQSQLGALRQQVVSALEPSAYNTVDFSSLFRQLF